VLENKAAAPFGAAENVHTKNYFVTVSVIGALCTRPPLVPFTVMV